MIGRAAALYQLWLCLGQFLVTMAVKVKKSAEHSMQKRDNKAFFVAFERSKCIDSVVVGLCVDCPKHWRFVSSNSDHFALPRTALFLVWILDKFNVREEPVIVALQRLMVPCGSAKIKNELGRTCRRNCNPNPQLLYAERLQGITSRRSSEQNNREIEPSVPAFKYAPPCCVVKSVSQHIEPDVLSGVIHFIFPFAAEAMVAVLERSAALDLGQRQVLGCLVAGCPCSFCS